MSEDAVSALGLQLRYARGSAHGNRVAFPMMRSENAVNVGAAWHDGGGMNVVVVRGPRLASVVRHGTSAKSEVEVSVKLVVMKLVVTLVTAIAARMLRSRTRRGGQSNEIHT